MFCLPLKNFAQLSIPSGADARFHLLPSSSSSSSILSFPISRTRNRALKAAKQESESEVSYKVITALRSKYNEIVIVDSPESRMLLLDHTHSVHSIINKEQEEDEDKWWTGSIWDEFATLPPIIPSGPVAILGLAAGTAARLMLRISPSLQIHGYEIDDILIRKCRDHLGLSDLEIENESGGVVHVHVGDALFPSGVYAGMVVDLFSGGKVLPEMEAVETWLRWRERLMPEGRIMVNCGGSDGGSGILADDQEGWRQNKVIQAISEAFSGQCSWKRMPMDNGANYMALTGALPDVASWSASLPLPLRSNVNLWRTCS